ncbi:hypothetical protein LCGC14_0399510 [marine sediment metagenome]|uniref:Helicase HerA central domain-containing protein n=1 Tax=marine sediment metagenome TaxID=412755 RepID=A0A0F9T2P8_9ZZZZ
MKAIHIGKSRSKRFTLPPDFVTETAAILARRGGGKTYTGNVVAEGFLENGFQVVVIDPCNAWWGLRSSANGKSPGYPIVIFGGPRGDLPLEVPMARGIADLVAENPDFSCVLSLRHLRKGPQKQFVCEFAEQLFHRKGEEKLATAVHIFIDEAHRFAPQFVRADDAKVMGAVGDLVLGGRQAGIGVTLITQRSAKLNKDVLTQAELLIVGQITGPQDKKAVREWIEENADAVEQGEFITSLAKLKRGEFWFWSPAKLDVFARVDVRKRTTFDSSATPKTGRRPKSPKRVSKVDLAKLQETLQQNLQEIEERDPKALKRRIAELERAARKSQPASVTLPAPTLDKASLKKAVDSALDERDDQWRISVEGFMTTLDERLRTATASVSSIEIKAPARSKFKSIQMHVPNVQVDVRPPVSTLPPVTDDMPLNKCEIALLGVLVSRDRPVSKKLVALQSGYSIKSGHFNNTLSGLRKRGLIGGTDNIVITLGGSQVFAASGAQAITVDIDHWIAHGSKCTRAILQKLKDNRDPMSRQEIANATGYSATSGHFNNTLSKLRGLLLIEGTDFVSLSAELFG